MMRTRLDCDGVLSIRLERVFHEPVAHAAHGLDRHFRSRLCECLTHPRDQRFDRVGGQFTPELGKPFLDGGLCHHRPAATHQRAEETPLAEAQFDELAARPHLALGVVELQAAAFEDRTVQVRGTAQQGTDPRQQLGVVERLDQVVVGAAVEAGHAVVDAAAGRDDQDRGRDALGAQPADGGQAVAVRQAEIDDQQVVVDGLDHAVELGHGRGLVQPIAGARQRISQEFLKSLAVFHQKQAHGLSHP